MRASDLQAGVLLHTRSVPPVPLQETAHILSGVTVDSVTICYLSGVIVTLSGVTSDI